MKTLLLTLALLLATTLAFAGGQHVIPDYATAQRNFFWTKLYVKRGRELQPISHGHDLSHRTPLRRPAQSLVCDVELEFDRIIVDLARKTRSGFIETRAKWLIRERRLD